MLNAFKFTKIHSIEVTYDASHIRGVSSTYKVDLGQTLTSMNFAFREDGLKKITLYLKTDEFITSLTTYHGNIMEAL